MTTRWSDREGDYIYESDVDVSNRPYDVVQDMIRDPCRDCLLTGTPDCEWKAVECKHSLRMSGRRMYEYVGWRPKTKSV